MLSLGELYYYDKLLDQSGDVSHIADILGVVYDSSLDELGVVERIATLKDLFIENYNAMLKESGLLQVERAFNAVTDVFLVDSDTVLSDQEGDSLSAMVSSLNQWVKNGQKLEELETLLSSFELTATTSLPAFSLYYGVHVLYYLAQKLVLLQNITPSDTIIADTALKDIDAFSLSTVNKMLAICPASLNGLFQSSGIETVNGVEDINKVINYIEGKIHKDESYTVLLSLGIDDMSYQKIAKHFETKVLICKIPEDIKTDETKNSFAALALKTIGLSEAVIKDEIAQRDV